MRFSLRQMLLAAILATVAIYGGVSLWRNINGNYDELVSLFERHPKIASAKVWPIREGFADLLTDAYGVEFTLVGKPESVIALSTPSPDLFHDSTTINLDRIGDISLCARYVDEQSGLRGVGSVDIGPQSKLESALPMPIHNIDELIENYDEFLAHFRKWPTSAKVGAVTLSPTSRIEYWAERAGSKP